MNIEKTPVYLKVVDEILENYTYGDFIKSTWLIESLGVKYKNQMTLKEYSDAQFFILSQTDKLKTHLLERNNMALKNVRGDGYLIIFPKDQSSMAMANIKTAMTREFRKCIKTLAYINLELLESDDIKKLDRDRGNIAALAAYSRKSLRSK